MIANESSKISIFLLRLIIILRELNTKARYKLIS